jgi:hypothetical protein
MSALVEGMVPMRLARETSANRRAKASGLAREVQLGDVSLDDRMYIDSPASDDQVRLALAPPAVREAVTMLLLRREWIEITTSSIRLGPDRDTPECFKLATMLPQVTALRALAGAPRPTSVALPALPARAALANWVADATVFLGVPSAFVSFAWFLPTPMSSVFLHALGLGLAAWVVLGWPLRKAVAGRSSSPSHLGRLRMKSLLGLPAVALTSLLLVNASHSRRVTVQGRVAAVTADEDDRETHHVEIRLDNGLELSVSVRGRLPVVHRPVTATVRRGLLGIWYAAHLDDLP